MTKPGGVAPPEAEGGGAPPPWGTWEELLLAFAVNRHGTGEWDSIASELKKRTSDPNLIVTAQMCRLKYLDLKRRFVAESDDLEEEEEARGDGKSGAEAAAPVLEELRKLRVAELRREVQRYDLNIESLEKKVKNMEDEREKSTKREKTETDLENTIDEKKTSAAEPEAAGGGEPAAGDEMEKDQMSVNESNSTDPGGDKLRTNEKQSEPAQTGGDESTRDRTGTTSEEPAEQKSEPDQKSLREDSCNGSSNSIEKSDRKTKTKAEPASDSVESKAESDGGGAEATKENSDVQSSASRSRKEEGSDKVRRGSTSGDEREHEDQSRTVKELSSAESQPMVDFLKAIRAHKLGSVFERRLRSQETSKYQKVILEHIDLETVENRLKEGWYSRSSSKFYRDLLLLVNNALVFFNKGSPEANAASEIRWLISKEISQKYARSESSSGKQVSLQSLSVPKKDENDASNSLLKPRLSGSLIVCRKRSSIAAKSADKKKEQIPQEEKEKETKTQRSSQEEPKITKKRTRDRFPSASANSKKTGKNQNSSKNSVSDSGKGGKGGSSSSQPVETKNEGNKKSQKETTLDTASKKRGAANFLNRMKQGSSSNNGALLDALKNTPLTGESKGGSKNENTKRGEKKEQVTRRSNAETRQQAKEKGSPGKRNVGRPPKRGAGPSPPAAAAGKRGRDRVEAEAASSKNQPKKRTRKL